MDPKAVVFLVLFACAFVVMPSLVLRYRRLELRHRERMVAFDKGIPIPPDPPETGATTLETYQLRGLIWLAAGIGLGVVLFIMMPMLAGQSQRALFFQEQNLKQAGYTKEEIREAINTEEARIEVQRQRSRSLAALGILPAAVGAAYLFFYYEQRKRGRHVKME